MKLTANSNTPQACEANGDLAIEAINLVKNYKKIRALRSISISIRKGETVALIGPNGAGKSTFVEILMGLRKPDDGQVRVLGHDIRRSPRAHLREIGIQLQDSCLFYKLTVREYAEFFANLFPKHVDLPSLYERLSLTEKLDVRIEKLSGGQRQRVALALALINDPALVILDEPTAGLDPIIRREFWSLIASLKSDGKTILFTTHYMDEAAALADRILMISDGQLMANGTVDEIIGDAGADVNNLDEAYAHFVRQHTDCV